MFLGSPPSLAKRAIVAVHRCPGYASCSDPIRMALRNAGLEDRVRNTRVLLKPNMMKASLPEKAEATHPSFVAALTEALVEAGCEVCVGDSSGLIGLTQEVFDSSGMTEAVHRAGGQVVNFDAGPFERIEVGGRVRSALWVPRVLFEVDHILQVPKLKTHTLTGMSCCIKNLMGMLPGATKCDLHVRLPDPLLLSHGILDIAKALEKAGVPLSGAVVDGIWAQARKGNRKGSLLAKTGFVAASKDLVAADLICATRIGGNPANLSTVVAARQRGLGPESIHQIEVLGDAGVIDDPTIAPASPGMKDRFQTAHVAHYWLRGRILAPWHDASRCCATRACVEICPTRSIQGSDGGLVIHDSCIRCFACCTACPHGAMRLRAVRGTRRWYASRAEGVDVLGLVR